MGSWCKFIIFTLTIGSAFVIYKLIIEPYPRPILEDEYWGPKSDMEKREDDSVRPFKIEISQKVIEDLRERLKRELNSDRLLPPLEGAGFEYGFNSKYLKTIGNYWLNEYDWSSREKSLNKYPHFKTTIGGLDIHFLHVKPKEENGKHPRPLLVLHGWPSSFAEFYKIIPLLLHSKKSRNTYELVIPSLPGYGFSSPAARPGMGPAEVANIFKRLMKRLGHERFFIMGGDWGGVISQEMASLYPENIVAGQSTFCTCLTFVCHLRYLMATIIPDLISTGDVIKAFHRPVKYFTFMIQESGYFHIQGTKPDLIGIGLTHSPLGLASYILEIFSAWTNRTYITREDGGLLDKFALDDLLDNVMIYWVTSSITSSQRLYYEASRPWKVYSLDRTPIHVPFSCQVMPEEPFGMPEFVLVQKFKNLTKYELAPRGGHFPALEEPALLADNVISHFDNF